MKEQHEKLSNMNKTAQYQKIISDYEEKILELSKSHITKKKFEKDNQHDIEFNEYMDNLQKNSKIQDLTTSIAKMLIGPNLIREL